MRFGLRFAFAVVSLTLVVGCVGPAPPWSVEDCKEGNGRFLFRITVASGYGTSARPFDIAVVDRHGVATHLRGETEADADGFAKRGNGNVTAPPGTLKNVTVADAKQILIDINYHSDDMDYRLTEAYAATVTDFDELCRILVQDFTRLKSLYSDGIADTGGLLMFAYLADGDHRVEDATTREPRRLQGFQDKIDVIMAEVKVRAAA